MMALSLTATEQRLYDILSDHANEGLLCPTNEVIAHQLGWGSGSAVSTAIRAIEEKEFIAVERDARWRRITIVATGKTTEAYRSDKPADIERRKRREVAIRATEAASRSVPDSPVEALRAKMAAEAESFQRTRAAARMLSSNAITEPDRIITLGRPREPVRMDVVEAAQDRSPCFNCGVRRDRHDVGGCRKWRGLE